VTAPQRESEVPYLDFAPLENTVARLQKSAKNYDQAYAQFANGSRKLEPAQRNALNSALRELEQTLLTPEGLPGRTWYRHLIYAPGLLTGYGVKTLPGVREAIEDQRWEEANRYAQITATALNTYCDRLDRAAELLK
jgi:N-acetylated-alpha-linked acidic dipeptidase